MESGTQSKAIICETDNHDEFTVKTLDVKGPGKDCVRVQMKYATFSKHDSHQHAHDSSAEYPYLAGYDGVGTVEAIGEGVDRFQVGDHVAVFMVPGTPLQGKTNIPDHFAKIMSGGKFWKLPNHLDSYSDDKSIAGFHGVGTWSQLAVFHHAHLLKLDHEPTVQDAALGSCLATGLMGPTKILNVDEGANIAVFGSNSYALSLVAGLKAHKPESVVVVGNKDDQELFEKFGAKFVADEGEPTDIQKQLMEITADGYDYTFEASNFNRFGTVAIEICHKGWGRCALLTKAAEKDAQISTKPFQLVTGRHWVGSYMGNVNIARDGDSLLNAHREVTGDLAEHLFPEDHVVSVDDFPAKWKELSETAAYHRTVIKF